MSFTMTIADGDRLGGVARVVRDLPPVLGGVLLPCGGASRSAACRERV
jgi:hypothetical protein